MRYAPETIGLIGAMLIADAMFFGGHRFLGVQPHPFWIPVLLIAMQYGFGGAVFAALIASIALYVGALPVRDEGVDFYAYVGMLAGQPAAWLAVAALLGGLRTIHVQRAALLAARVTEGERSISELGAGLTRALGEIGLLERSIASRTFSVEAVIDGLARLDMTSSVSLANSLGDVVHETLSVSAYTIYLRRGDMLEPMAIVDEDEEPTTTRTAIARSVALTHALKQPRAVLRRSVPEESVLLPPAALMMTAIYSTRTGQLHGVIVIERLRLGDAMPEADLALRLQALARALACLFDGASRSAQQPHKLGEVRDDQLGA